jgi:ATP-binding cassette subfamily F protein uup
MAQKQFTYISKLSGGEKKRLQLLSILFRNPNFLILDEPTNDLDLPTLDILEEFLLEFPGCIIIVSHDRYFMDKIVDHLFVFEGQGEIRDFPGNYSQYREVAKAEQKAQSMEALPTHLQPEANTVAIDKPKPSNNKLSFKEKRELELLNTEIPKLEAEKRELEEAMSQAGGDFQAIQKMGDRMGQIINELEEKEMRWLELSEKV